MDCDKIIGALYFFYENFIVTFLSFSGMEILKLINDIFIIFFFFDWNDNID